MIVKISDDHISTAGRHGTEMWTSQVPRVARTTRPKLVNDAAIRLENVHSTTAVVDHNDAAMRIAADTFRTK